MKFPAVRRHFGRFAPDSGIGPKLGRPKNRRVARHVIRVTQHKAGSLKTQRGATVQAGRASGAMADFRHWRE